MPVFEAGRTLRVMCFAAGHLLRLAVGVPSRQSLDSAHLHLHHVPPTARLGPPGFPSPLGGPLPPPPSGLLLPPSVHVHIVEIMHKTRGALQPEDFDPPPPQMLVREGRRGQGR